MFINELEGYFGKFSENIKDWIKDNLENLDEDLKSSYFTALRNAHNKRDGIPNIETLQRVYEKVMDKKPKIYYWAICSACGCEYEYELPICPQCYKEGFECREIKVTKSEFKPPFKLVRYNKHFLVGDGKELSCYKCPNNYLSWCSNYGNPNWECRDYKDCKCAVCCAREKRVNAEMYKNKSYSGLVIRIPLKKEVL